MPDLFTIPRLAILEIIISNFKLVPFIDGSKNGGLAIPNVLSTMVVVWATILIKEISMDRVSLWSRTYITVAPVALISPMLSMPCKRSVPSDRIGMVPVSECIVGLQRSIFYAEFNCTTATNYAHQCEYYQCKYIHAFRC